MPFAIVPGLHPFTVTSQFTVTGVMAIISFGTVLVVGLWKHKLHFFSLFVPHGTPFVLKLLIVLHDYVAHDWAVAIMLLVVKVVNGSKGWYEAGAGQR